MHSDPLRIAIMAKAPVPGLAKTRLAPALGAAGAAALAERLLRHAVAQAAGAAPGRVTLWAAPDATHPVFADLARQHGLALAVQPVTPDLGARMAAVFARQAAGGHAAGAAGQAARDAGSNAGSNAGSDACSDACSDAGSDAGNNAGNDAGSHAGSHAANDRGPLLLMGSDIPALCSQTLRHAGAALQDGHPVVFVPALDGGYALVGLRADAEARHPGLHAALFRQMVWSTAQVMAQTRQRLAVLGVVAAELPAVPDIDEPDDLAHLPAGWLPP